MREKWRAACIVVRYVYRADPVRSVASALVSLAMVISSLGFAVVLKFLTDAAFQRDKGAIAVAAALLAAQSATLVGGAWASTTLGVALRERATLHFDSRMAELASGIHHIEHLERPDYLDEMFILQHNHQQLAAVQDALVNNLSTLVRLVLTVAILASIQPLLLLLPLAGIPSVLASVHVAHLRHRVEDQVAPQRRLVLRLFEIGSDRDAAKEIRVYDLGPDLLARSDRARAIAHGLEDHAELRAGLFGGLGWLFFGLGFVAAMVLVARQAATGHASPGDVVLALTLAGTVNSGVTGLANAVGWLLDNLKTGQRSTVPISDSSRLTHGAPACRGHSRISPAPNSSLAKRSASAGWPASTTRRRSVTPWREPTPLTSAPRCQAGCPRSSAAASMAAQNRRSVNGRNWRSVGR